MNGGKNETYNMDKKTKHCCKWMDLFIQDPRVAIVYWPNYRMLLIPLLQKGKLIATVTKGITIEYCPWCSEKLPTTLYSEWLKILEKEYGLNDPDNKEQKLLIPDEFKTDEWWKKRGY